MATHFSHKNANVDINGSDISGDTNNCVLTIDIDVGEDTCFGDSWKEYVEDIAGWSLSIAGFTDQTAGEVEAVLFALIGGGAVAMLYYPQGTSAGYKFTGDVILTSHSVGGPLEGPCPYAATFQGTGELSRSAFGA